MIGVQVVRLVKDMGPESKLLGRWENGKVGGGYSYLYPVNWKYVEFRPKSQVIVGCAGHDNLLSYQVIDGGRINIGGAMFNYTVDNDILRFNYLYDEFGPSSNMKTSFAKSGSRGAYLLSLEEESKKLHDDNNKLRETLNGR